MGEEGREWLPWGCARSLRSHCSPLCSLANAFVEAQVFCVRQDPVMPIATYCRRKRNAEQGLGELLQI